MLSSANGYLDCVRELLNHGSDPAAKKLVSHTLKTDRQRARQTDSRTDRQTYGKTIQTATLPSIIGSRRNRDIDTLWRLKQLNRESQELTFKIRPNRSKRKVSASGCIPLVPVSVCFGLSARVSLFFYLKSLSTPVSVFQTSTEYIFPKTTLIRLNAREQAGARHSDNSIAL